MTLESVVDDMLGFLDALDLDRVHYVGESSGGLFGMAFAAKHPDRLKSLTLCASPTTLPKETIDSHAPPSQESQEAAFAEASAADSVQNAVDQRLMSALDADHLNWIIGEWQKNHRHVLIDLARLLNTVDVSDQLAQIKVPTLVLAPTKSPLAPLDLQRRTAQMIPNSELVEIAGIGHEIYVDQANACIRALRSFLDRINGH